MRPTVCVVICCLALSARAQEFKTPDFGKSSTPPPPPPASVEERKQEEKKQEEKKQEEKKQEEEKKEEEKKSSKPEPELNLPIRYFIYAALLTGLGVATGIFSAGPEKRLRNYEEHRTPKETADLYNQAYYGGIISKSFYGAAGAMSGYAGYKTQGAIREYLTAKAQAEAARPPPPSALAIAPPGERRPDLIEPLRLEAQGEVPPGISAGFAVSPGGGGVFLTVEF